MGPAKLPSLDPVVAAEPVADDDLPAVGPQQVLGDVGPPGRGDGEDRHQTRHDRPEPRLVSALLPRGLIDVGRVGVPDVLTEFRNRGLQHVGRLPLQSGDHPGGDRQAQEVQGQLADGPLAKAVGTRQHAEDGPQPRAERPGGHARRQGRTGRGAAAGAAQAMEPVFVHHRLNRGHLGDLVSDRLGILAVQLVAAPAAMLGLALDDPTELFGRDQAPRVVAMTGLAAPLLARGGSRGLSLDRRGIGRGGFGGVGGVGVEPLLQVGDPLLQHLEPYPKSGLGLGWHRTPQRLRDWRGSTHAAWYTGDAGFKQYPTLERLRP
jgi:hypothetical protein